MKELKLGETAMRFECDQLGKVDDSHGDRVWPKITVVTPSFNQVDFLEESIRSVLLQEYPNLEYILLDGGSTDGSVEIIKKYSPRFSHWESHPDHGQSNAINRGLKAGTGEIQCWINSDDYLALGALAMIAKTFSEDIETQWIVGAATLLDHQGNQSIRSARHLSPSELMRWTRCNWFCQQATFWRTSLIQQTGFLNESLHYTMDWELWLRFYAVASPRIIDQPLAFYRFHENAKCVDQLDRYYFEEIRLLLSIVDAAEDSPLARYRNEARGRLLELWTRAYQSEETQRSSLQHYGGFELMTEVVRRTFRWAAPNSSKPE